MILSEEQFWFVGDSTQKRILLHHIQVILNRLNTIDSLQFYNLSTEILRKELMAETDPNEFEIFIELMCLKDVVQSTLDDGWNLVAYVVSASRKDDAAKSQ